MKIEEFKQAGYHDVTYEHREILMDFITPYQPDSVLDVGSGSGADLWLIKQAFPHAKLTGIDKTPSNLDGATIITGSIQEELPKLTEKYDIIITNGVLMYLNAQDTIAALEQMKRLANKAIILSEINPYEPKNAFDYTKHFENVKIHKIPPHIRASTQWSQNGYIYEIMIG